MKPLTEQTHQRLIDTVRKKIPATLFFPDVQVLHVYSGTVRRENVWISGDRIAYVGPDEPLIAADTQVCRLNSRQIMVPAYIEPHAHPFLLANPLELGSWLSEQGTMISINDDSFALDHLTTADLDRFVQELERSGRHSWLWWAYFEEGRPATADLKKWLEQPYVMQGGELSHWLPLKFGSPDLYAKLFAVRRAGKRMEGHLPGSSVNTLNLFAAAGISADHEAMNADEVINRLNLGYYTAIRYSSIRPDLPAIMRALAKCPDLDLSKLMLTNDGASLPFLRQATHAAMIRLAMDCGIPAPAAYRMATLNPAVYYRLDAAAGSITPGRVADINILEHLDDPQPTSVLFEGQWIVRDGQKLARPADLSMARFLGPADTARLPENAPSGPESCVGIALQNSVITRPYTFDPETALADNECYLTYICRATGARLCTRIANFSRSLQALASTYSASGDILLIGRDRAVMAAEYQKIIGGFQGITAQFAGNEGCAIRLNLLGIMSEQPVDALTAEAEAFSAQMKESGFAFDDPFFCLFFLTERHLPFIRLTAAGMLDIKTGTIIAPTAQ